MEPRIVNWGIYDKSISLTEGRETYFPNSILLGGYDDRTGVLAEGSDAGIEAHAKEILQEMEGYPFIVGSDCTLPTEIPYEKIRKVVEAVEKYGKPLYGGENR